MTRVQSDKNDPCDLFYDIITVLEPIFYVSTFNALNLNKNRNHVVELCSHIGVKSGKDVVFGYKQNSGFSKILQYCYQLRIRNFAMKTLSTVQLNK